MQKRYYWLKMEENFFKDIRIKKLRKLAGGDTYTIIYLKLMLSSLETEGIITYEGIEDSLAEEVALLLDEEADNINVTLTFLIKCGLLVELDNGQFYLPQVVENLGSEGASAKRVRDFRERQKKQEALQCNTEVTEVKQEALQCNTEVTDMKQNGNGEIDIEKEIDIDTTTTTTNNNNNFYLFGLHRHIRLTKDEYKSLLKTYGVEQVYLIITRFDDYIHKTGRNYNNHYETMLKWIEEDTGQRAAVT